jgi:hypothetical protein
LKGGVVGEGGVILAESTTETHAAEGPERVLRRVIASLRELVLLAGQRTTLAPGAGRRAPLMSLRPG